jgi:hypothetical protein
MIDERKELVSLSQLYITPDRFSCREKKSTGPAKFLGMSAKR